MNAKKTPILTLRVLAPESRRAAAEDDKRLIACEKLHSDRARLTAFLGPVEAVETVAVPAGAATREMDVDDLIGEAGSTDAGLIELVVEIDDEWPDGISPMLAALRDRLNRPLLVHFGSGHPIGGTLDREMVSLGFTRQAGDEPLYLFDIETYKHTPDWLNARHWANPELWGKYRW